MQCPVCDKEMIVNAILKQEDIVIYTCQRCESTLIAKHINGGKDEKDNH